MQSSSRRTAAADPRLRAARTRATGRRRRDGWLGEVVRCLGEEEPISDLVIPVP